MKHSPAIRLLLALLTGTLFMPVLGVQTASARSTGGSADGGSFGGGGGCRDTGMVSGAEHEDAGDFFRGMCRLFVFAGLAVRGVVYPELRCLDEEIVAGRIFHDICSAPYAAELNVCPHCGASQQA